jgi:8-oxo-dGTP pyrophosphatase MutT (NUDIX family)
MEENVRQTISAGGVVMNRDGLILVVNQRGRAWSLPKGHIDEGESAIDAAKREIYEESGISQLELFADLGKYQRHKLALDGGDDVSELKTIIIFLFKTDQTLLHPMDPENPEARWVEKEKVAELLTHRKDKEFFISIKNRIMS